MKNKFSSFDLDVMHQAINLAKLAKNTSPNPPVGAILVKNKKIISSGYHRGSGKPHAEIEALRKVTGKTKNAILYVTLEPCCHLNKRTPPCVNEIVKSGISKVVIGSFDPNPQVNGKGIALLRKNKIKVSFHCLKEETESLIRAYKKWIVTKLPYLILKSAISLDGKIATANGDSHWITGEASRRKVHELRSVVDAILIGSHTALKDNPQLTVRGVKGKSPLRIVLDSTLQLPLDLNLFQNLKKYPTLVATLESQKTNPRLKLLKQKDVDFIFCRKVPDQSIDTKDLFFQLGQRNLTSILVEGGGSLNSTLLDQRLIDEFWLFIAPIVIGGKGVDLFSQFSIQNLKAAPRFSLIESQRVGEDLWMRLRLIEKSDRIMARRLSLDEIERIII